MSKTRNPKGVRSALAASFPHALPLDNIKTAKHAILERPALMRNANNDLVHVKSHEIIQAMTTAIIAPAIEAMEHAIHTQNSETISAAAKTHLQNITRVSQCPDNAELQEYHDCNFLMIACGRFIDFYETRLALCGIELSDLNLQVPLPKPDTDRRPADNVVQLPQAHGRRQPQRRPARN